MFYCKKKKNTMGVIGAFLLGAGALAAAGYLLCRHRSGCKKKMPFPNLDLCFSGMAEKDHDCGCGCQVPDTDNDLRSYENRVVNSENRLINTPCEPDDFSNYEIAHDE